MSSTDVRACWMAGMIFSKRASIVSFEASRENRNVSTAAEALRLGPRGRGPQRRGRGFRACAGRGAVRREADRERERAVARGDQARCAIEAAWTDIAPFPAEL